MKGFIQRKLPYAALAVLGLIMVFLGTSLFTYFYFAKDLKSKDSIMNRNNTGLVLYDRNNQPFFTFYEGRYGEYVPLSDIPKHVRDAVIAAEDKEFYNHPGFSFSGILRAAIDNYQNKEIVSGGSTITQQLVKNAILTSRRDFLRKYQELIIAQEIERKYTKDEILEMYLNSVYFGEGAFGIGQAAKQYFSKTPEELTIGEASMLAGALPAPSKYSPTNGNARLAKARQKYVLSNMLSEGYITRKQYVAAAEKPIALNPPPKEINVNAPHFALMVRDQLVEEYGEEYIIRSGFKVKTTIDIALQKQAELIVEKNVERLAGNNVSNGAAVVIDPNTGEILTLVGSKDWYDDTFGKFNVADTPQQPGSAFKPIVYALAMQDRKITPATQLTDRPTTFQRDYKPENYDKKFRGRVMARRALANSLNVPAVQVMEMLGVEPVLAFSKEMGITTLKGPSHYGLSLVLGTGEVKLTELTNAYATFANNGNKNALTSILEINNKDGNQLYTYTPVPEQVIEPEVAFLISSILSDRQVRREVFGSTLDISRTAAVKTGTTENYRDAWTVGYTPQVAVGVWVGNNDNEPMDTVAGSLGAAPIWKDIMELYLTDKKEIAFAPPSGVTQIAVCSNGMRARFASTSVRSEYFISGTEPNAVCSPPKPKDDDKKDENNPGDQQSPSQDQGPPVDQASYRQLTEEKIKEKLKEMEDKFKEKKNQSHKISYSNPLA